LFLNNVTDTIDDSQAVGELVVAVSLCRAHASILTTKEPAAQVTSMATTMAGTMATTTTEAEIVYQTSTVTVTEVIILDLLGAVTCADPYVIEIELNWWERLEILIGGSAAIVICCCCPCVCWFVGVCDVVGEKCSSYLDRHPSLKRCSICRLVFCLGRCLWRFCPCLRFLAAMSPRNRSPRQNEIDKRRGSLDSGTKAMERQRSRSNSSGNVGDGGLTRAQSRSNSISDIGGRRASQDSQAAKQAARGMSRASFGDAEAGEQVGWKLKKSKSTAEEQQAGREDSKGTREDSKNTREDSKERRGSQQSMTMTLGGFKKEKTQDLDNRRGSFASQKSGVGVSSANLGGGGAQGYKRNSTMRSSVGSMPR